LTHIKVATEVGTVVAFVSGLAKLNDPWGDIVNWFRKMTSTDVKYRLIDNVIDTLAACRDGGRQDGLALALGPAQRLNLPEIQEGTSRRALRVSKDGCRRFGGAPPSCNLEV
jgi:hypothetical protein